MINKKILFTIIFLVMACKDSTRNMKIIFNSYGKSTEVSLSNDDYAIVTQKLKNLFYHSSEILRLFVDQTRINELIQNKESVEFTFSNETKFISQTLGEESCTRLLIPLSGEFVGNTEDPIITMFISNLGEYSEPIRNKNGYLELMEIKSLINQNIK